jgi:hypothetical protein
LYEIEFFDDAASLQTAPSEPVRRTPDDEPGLERPLDPRLREIITAAACGWVIGSL